jgi:lipoprotein-anchoring transpeptidase ErfK/SrfK
MTTQFDEARSAVQKAREALRDNDRTRARQWAEHAASLAPQMEDPWLILAAVASPRASVEYIQRALKINPESPRAHQGMEWAAQRLREDPAPAQNPPNPAPVPAQRPSAKNIRAKQSRLLPILVFGLGCILCAAAALSATSSPVLAAFLNNPLISSAPTHPQSWAHASIPKPTYTPNGPAPEAAMLAPASTPTDGPTDRPTGIPTGIPTDLPTILPTLIPTQIAQVIDTLVPTVEPTTSGSLTLQYVPDTLASGLPTNVPVPTMYPPLSQPAVATTGGQRWIDVDLSKQTVYAYDGNSVVNSFLVSTGTWQYPTVTGQYHIYVKLRFTDMAGPGYFLPNVPYTMYFYRGYGLHGTYWHHNFGTPMSHGCVNLATPDAEWLYNWASVGTLVNVHN